MPFFLSPKRSHKRNRIWFWCVGFLIVGIVGGMFAWPKAKGRYHRWGTQRHVRKASEALEQNDPRHAILSARNALEHSPLDVEATRIMAKALEAIGAPEAEQWRAKLDTLQPGDTENVLARAGAALKTGSAEMAEEVLHSLGPAARDSAAYHSVAAAIAMNKRDTASAESHWAEAVRLQPEATRHRLNLANVRLESKTPGVREGALAVLDDLRGKPGTSIEALRLLLADAIRQREAAVARDVADALVADKRCTFQDKLTRLTTLRRIRDARSGPYLLELRDAAMSEPAELYSLLMWMNANDLSLMVAEWVRRMPAEIMSKPPVGLGVAEAYVRVAEWQKLQEFTSASTWGDLDYLRRAFLALALDRLEEAEEARGEWTKAVAAARGHPEALERLAKFAVQAKWNKRAEDIMWILAARPQSPRWVLDSLWQNSVTRRDTAQLHKLSSVLAKKDPKSVASRNNYAFLSLLTRTDEGNPQRVAEALHREHPENALIASTYGLSLCQQGKAEQAVALMSALKPEDLRQPQVALYYAIFLIAAGHAERAEDYLKLSAEWPMLPEEKALLDRVRVANAKEAASPRASTTPASRPEKKP